ncbi:MAG: hypothetical protein DIU62_006105 [Pseudomonadota bacterium]|jgi:hypothetical protein|nr:MAG: hypothetical protein DIU62_15580 [Pseudomonadota bacterium]
MTDPATPNGSRRTLYLLLAVFFLPLVASFVLYYGVEWRPAAGANHGELLQPLRQLPGGAARALEGKWALVYVGDGACDAACRDALHVARQTHVLLNKDTNRVRRALLATSGCCDRAFLESEHGGIEIIDAADPALREPLLAVLPPGDHAHDLFVVDPLSNIVLRFDTREDPRGLLEDLKKLLKLSHIG